MEKIIKLLNEYDGDGETWKLNSEGEIMLEDLPEFVSQAFFEVLICSRHYGFIKRLVDNDKIDKKGFFWFLYGPHFISDLSDAIIAWLAISDTPIAYLIDLLK